MSTPPPNYRCPKCDLLGDHWIMKCPKSNKTQPQPPLLKGAFKPSESLLHIAVMYYKRYKLLQDLLLQEVREMLSHTSLSLKQLFDKTLLICPSNFHTMSHRTYIKQTVSVRQFLIDDIRRILGATVNFSDIIMMEVDKQISILPNDTDWRIICVTYVLGNLLYKNTDHAKAFTAWIINAPKPLTIKDIKSILNSSGYVKESNKWKLRKMRFVKRMDKRFSKRLNAFPTERNNFNFCISVIGATYEERKMYIQTWIDVESAEVDRESYYNKFYIINKNASICSRLFIYDIYNHKEISFGIWNNININVIVLPYDYYTNDSINIIAERLIQLVLHESISLKELFSKTLLICPSNFHSMTKDEYIKQTKK
eukprot:17776_1